jgi:hypothetical protein
MTKVPDAKPSEPSVASLEEMPEINEPRFAVGLVAVATRAAVWASWQPSTM